MDARLEGTEGCREAMEACPEDTGDNQEKIINQDGGVPRDDGS